MVSLVLLDFRWCGEPEPESYFTREPYGGAAGFKDFGDFDQVGDPDVFRDVIVGYLGGKLIGSNLPGDPMSIYYYDTHGFDGLDMTEFVDGARCRDSWNTDANIYNINDAPTSCP